MKDAIESFAQSMERKGQTEAEALEDLEDIGAQGGEYGGVHYSAEEVHAIITWIEAAPHVFDLACDQPEAQEFAEYLRKAGHDAMVANSTTTCVDGELVTASEAAREIASSAWDAYCNGLPCPTDF